MRKSITVLMTFLLLLSGGKAFSQTGTVTGTVTDSNGEPLIGVNISVKGTAIGSITNIDGIFTIQQVPARAVLVFSYIGFVNQEITVGNQTVFNVQLLDDAQLLDDVVVVGYGTQRKRDVAGAISTISSKDLQIESTTNVQTLLQGRLAGVSVQNSATPGEASVVRVRGIGTLNNNDPLYVIDGFPTKENVLASLSPTTIESIQVLKDAASASIYGAQAANGVILITTKQGSEGKTNVDIKVNTGVRVPTKFPEMLNSQQYGEVLWNAMKNAGMTTQHAQYGAGPTPVIPDYIVPYGAKEGSFDLNTYNIGANQYMRANKQGTNWGKELFVPAQTTTADLSLSAGGRDSKFFLNLNYLNEDKIVKYGGYDRLSIRSNSRFTFLNIITLGTNLNVTYANNKGNSDVSDGLYVAPLIPVYDINGNWAGSKANGLGDQQNPVARLYNARHNNTADYRMLGNVFLEIKLLKELVFKTDVGATIRLRESKDFSPVTYWNKGDKNQLINSLSESRGNTNDMVWNNTLTYTKLINNSHNITVLAGTEAKSYSSKTINASVNNFTSEELDYRYLSAGEGTRSNSSSGLNEYTLFSLFSRINYSFADKYYIGAIIRKDGSSRFGPNNRYGYFPGINVAWRLSEESFLQDIGFIDDFKIKGSWGKTGNQDIREYAYASTYETNVSRTDYPIAGDPNRLIPGIAKSSIGNPNIKWETTRQTNVGFDATLFQSRLSIGFDYFDKYTYDILQSVAYPATAGIATSPYDNIGELANKGLELSANWRSTSRSDFTYDIGAVIFGYRNEVKKLADNQIFINTGSYNRTEVGKPIGFFYGYQLDGIFQTQEEVDRHATQTAKNIGRWRIKDVNEDGVINANDRTMIGNPHPKFEYSLNGRFAYKNFDMTIYIHGTYGNDICFSTKSSIQTSTDFWSDYGNKSVRILDTWTPENRNAKLPMINILNPNSESGLVTSYNIENGSYIRLKNLEIGYSIPSAAMAKIGMKHARIYVNADNVLTLTKYQNIDPEVRRSDDMAKGVDNVNSVPLTMYISGGFSISF